MNKKIGVCVDLTDNSVAEIKKSLKEMDFTGVEELHLIHGFQRQIYVDNFFFTQFPFQDQLKEIINSVSDVLTTIQNELTNLPAQTTVFKECLVSDFPKKEIADYVKEHGIDQLVIATRSKSGVEGFFSSSFAEYMLRHVESELKILRHKDIK